MSVYKKIKKKAVCSLVTFLLFVSCADSQTLVFYYVAPHSALSTFSGTDSTFCPIGYSKAQISGGNVAKFNATAPANIKYVYTQLQSGTALRTNLNKVLQNSQGRVTRIEYWIADDRTGFPVSSANNGGVFLPYPQTGTRYVWPAAFNYSPGSNNVFTGIIGLGEHQLATDQSQRTGGMRAVDEVVLHETSHTQFTGEWTKWGAIAGNAVTYGADGMHYFSIAEMIGDQEGALNEGLATFYGYIMNDQALQELMADYESAGYRYFVEGRSVLAGARPLYSVSDRRRDVLSGATYADGSPVTIFTYKWTSVPGFYLLFAECTSTAFYSIFKNYAYQNKDTSFSMITYAAQMMASERRKRFLSYACNRLAIKMEAYNASTRGQNDNSKTSSIFPFALLDLLTHFGMTDDEYQADYRRNYADRDPRAYAEYFTRRAAIKALVQADLSASPIRFSEALQRIITYCKQPANMF